MSSEPFPVFITKLAGTKPKNQLELIGKEGKKMGKRRKAKLYRKLRVWWAGV
jgi:hypothetical protein